MFVGVADGNKKKVYRSNNFSLYFFIIQKDADEAKSLLQKSKVEFLIDEGEYLYCFGRKRAEKLVFFKQEDFDKASDVLKRNDILVAEKLSAEQRVRIDDDLTVPTDIPILSIDIEVDARAGFPDPKEAKFRVLGIAAVDNSGKEVFISSDNEAEMFMKFQELASRYPLIFGWNSSNFDYPYLIKRAENIGLKLDFPFSSWIDAMRLYKMTDFARGKSLRLDDTIKRELGLEIKKEFTSLNRMQELYDSFVKKDGKLESYCMTDAKAVLALILSERLGLLELLFERANFSRTDFEDSMMQSTLVEAAKLSFAKKMKPRVVFPNKGRKNVQEESFQGGLVLEPSVGLWENVVCFDFASMYPRIMRTWNIDLDSYIGKSVSEESKDDYIATPDGKYFSKTPCVNKYLLEEVEFGRSFYKSIASSAVDHNVKRIATIRQAVLKTIANSLYGVMGLSSSRLFSKDVVESVAACGRWLLSQTVDLIESERFEKWKLKVIFGDTDSCFVVVKANVSPYVIINEVVPDVLEYVNQELKSMCIYEFNVPEKFYCNQLEFREYYYRFFIPTKKKYIGRILFRDGKLEDTIFTRGFAPAKFSEFALFKKFQQQLFDIIFREDKERILVKSSELLSETTRKLFAGEYDEDLVIQIGIHQLPDDYDSNQPYIRAAKMLQKQGLFRKGDIIKYVITAVHNGQVLSEPVVDRIPKISQSGYQYYLSRLKSFFDEIFVGNPNLSLNESLLKYIGGSK